MIKQLTNTKNVINDFEINQKKIVVKVVLKNVNQTITIRISIIKAFSFTLFIIILSKSFVISSIALFSAITSIESHHNKKLLLSLF